MIGITYDIYRELDPKKKTPTWANSIVTSYRRYCRRLKNVQIAWADRATMFSVNPLPNVKESFDDEDFKKSVSFQALPILEPMVNAVVEDITRTPPKAELKALDPTALDLKKKDIELLKNRAIIENDRSELQSRVVLPNYKLPYDKFNGNVEQFDKMGFDAQDEGDVSFYEQNLQRLRFE